MSDGLTRRQFVAGVAGSAAALSLAARVATSDAADEQPPQPASGFTYLNTASLGSMLPSVVNAMSDALCRLQADPMLAYGAMADEADAVRARAAAQLGCDADELSVTANTTQAMHMIAQGLDLAAGDRVLTTDHEHAGGLVCWQHLARRRGVLIDRVTLPLSPRDEAQLVELFERSVTPQTRVISVSHVTYTTGLQLPVRALADLARRRGLMLVVDGAQSAGSVMLNLHDLAADAYACSGHKWLLGPPGTGLLFIRKDAQPRIAPMALESGRRVYSGSAGMTNLPAVLGLGAAIDWLASQDESHFDRLLSLRDQAHRELTGAGFKSLSPPPGVFASPILTIAADQPQRLADALHERHGIVVRVVQHGGVKGIRVSFAAGNTEADLKRLIEALREAG